MRNFKFLILCVFCKCTLFCQVTLIPDSDFEQALIDQGIDSDGIVNGQVFTSDIQTITSLIINSESIDDLTGIEDFTNLEILNCADNFIQDLDLSSNLNLRQLIADRSYIQSIDISQNTLLEVLYLPHNELTSIDVSANVNLVSLELGNPDFDFGPFNTFSSLDLSNNIVLQSFRCKYCFALTDLNLSGLFDLETLDIGQSGLEQIDVSTLTSLRKFTGGYFADDNESFTTPLTSLDLSANELLEIVRLPNTSLSSLNLQNGNNSLITTFFAPQNDNLNCILVDDEDAATNGTGVYANWTVDDDVSFADDECTLSIEENMLAQTDIIENPVSSILRLSHTQEIDNVTILDMSGKLVQQFETGFEAMNVSTIKVGVYFVKIEMGNNSKILKMLHK